MTSCDVTYIPNETWHDGDGDLESTYSGVHRLRNKRMQRKSHLQVKRDYVTELSSASAETGLMAAATTNGWQWGIRGVTGGWMKKRYHCCAHQRYHYCAHRQTTLLILTEGIAQKRTERNVYFHSVRRNHNRNRTRGPERSVSLSVSPAMFGLDWPSLALFRYFENSGFTFRVSCNVWPRLTEFSAISKIRMLCFVPINSVLLNFLCVWIWF